MKKTIIAILLLPAAVSCRQPPRGQWEQLQLLRQQLLKSRAPEFCSQPFQQFESRYRRARQEFHRLSAQLALFRKPDPVAHDIDALLKSGKPLLECAQTRETQLRLEQQKRFRADAGRLEAFDSFRLRPGVRTLLARVHLKEAEAAYYWRREDFSRAEAVFSEIDRLFGRIQRRVDQLQERFQDPELLKRWSVWRQRTIERSRARRGAALLVDKFNRRALLYRRGKLVREFRVELGRNGLERKRFRGDGATPEGFYRVSRKKGAGATRYFRALLLNYPNRADLAALRRSERGGNVKSGTSPGGLIEIHGGGGRNQDWTDGCIALEDSDMERLFKLASVGMPVTIVGRLRQ